MGGACGVFCHHSREIMLQNTFWSAGFATRCRVSENESPTFAPRLFNFPDGNRMASIVPSLMRQVRSSAPIAGLVAFVDLIFRQERWITDGRASNGLEGDHHEVALHLKCKQLLVFMLDRRSHHLWHVLDAADHRSSKPDCFAASSPKSARNPVSSCPDSNQRSPYWQDGVLV